MFLQQLLKRSNLLNLPMNPFDNMPFAGKSIVGVSAPIASILATLPGDLNPWLQTIALLAGIIVSILSAASIIRKNLK